MSTSDEELLADIKAGVETFDTVRSMLPDEVTKILTEVQPIASNPASWDRVVDTSEVTESGAVECGDGDGQRVERVEGTIMDFWKERLGIARQDLTERNREAKR